MTFKQSSAVLGLQAPRERCQRRPMRSLNMHRRWGSTPSASKCINKQACSGMPGAQLPQAIGKCGMSTAARPPLASCWSMSLARRTSGITADFGLIAGHGPQPQANSADTDPIDVNTTSNTTTTTDNNNKQQPGPFCHTYRVAAYRALKKHVVVPV